MDASSSATDRFVHPALFYRDTVEYLEHTVPFVREGLAAGEPVAVAVPRGNLERLRAELGRDAERVRLMDMGEAGRNPGRIIPGVLRAFTDAHRGKRVRIIGEPIWPSRSDLEYPACVQHEALINFAFAGRDVTILCPYDAAGLHPRVLADAEATHPTLLDGTGQRASDSYAPKDIVNTYNRPFPEPPAAVAMTVGALHLARARYLVRERAGAAGLTGDRVADLELVATELLANSIDHGGGVGTLRLWTADTYLVCEVSDHGCITDPLAGRIPVPPSRAGGRGLLLVNHLSDLVRLHTGAGGTTVRAYFRLPRPQRGAGGGSVLDG
ncbi:anti-sigma regulatory factor [Longimycelium tulufanense]|uniref:Anti-sigma regulatory factor n=1 Tax=Longimycelium tulufanense TaxID=907463 RepID=A0A8J3FX28_9PSEU|nr:sensor histidine kinase [Longimycelium tulufanense]GGM71287.1 anti-sigma regulatory factor [Longimycelium tulufanense]